ncbi:MAG TPA: hypothetical protein VGC41_16395 [Kofleriaceae bacterium]
MRLLLFAALVGCGSTAPASTTPPPHAVTAPPADAAAPPALEDDPTALAQRSVVMYQAIAKALTDAKDCAAAAQSLDAVATAHQDVIAANAKTLHAGHEKIQRLKTALEPHDQELTAAAQTISSSPLMKSCSGDPAFAKAADRLLGEP